MNPDWTVLLIYSPPDDDGSVTNMWTKEVLVSIREFEQDVLKSDEYKGTCLAVDQGDSFPCNPEGFLTVLDFFESPADLETYTDAQIQQALVDVIDDPKKWKAYKSLFDNDVQESKQVKMMRSILSQAGPVKDGDKRYSNISEDETEQDKVQTEFQKSLRDRAESGDERYAKIKTRVFGRLLFDVLF